jgi:hypothetical protein
MKWLVRKALRIILITTATEWGMPQTKEDIDGTP